MGSWWLIILCIGLLLVGLTAATSSAWQTASVAIIVALATGLAWMKQSGHVFMFNEITDGDEDEDGEGDAEEGELSSLCWHEDVELYVIREAVPSEGGGAGAAAGEVVGR
mgnify:CR=1 FL=1